MENSVKKSKLKISLDSIFYFSQFSSNPENERIPHN